MTKLTIETPARLQALSNAHIPRDITEIKINFHISPATFRFLGNIITKLNLDSLDLSNTNMGPVEANAFSSMLRSVNVNIDKIYLQNNMLRATGMISVLKGFISSKTSVVDLSNNNIDLHLPLGEGFRAEVETIFRLCKIQNLILNGNNIGSIGAGVLARAFTQAKYLAKLSLENTEIRDAGARSIANMLKYSHIKYINLSNNLIGHEGSKAIAEALSRGYLEEIDLSGNTIGPEAARILAKVALDNPNIQVIELPTSHLGDLGAAALTEQLSASSINIMILDNNNIGDIGLAAISRAVSTGNLCRFIKTISIQTNNIGDAGAIAIADAMTHTRSLNLLNLMENGIGNVGATAIGNALRLSAVSKLNLAYNFIGDDGIEAIAINLPVSSITDLRVTGNTFTDAGIDALSRYVPSSLVNTIDEVLMIPKYWHVKETFVAPDGTPLFRIFNVPSTLYNAAKSLYPLTRATIEVDRGTQKPTVYFGTLNDLDIGVKFLILDFLAGAAHISGNHYRNTDIMGILGTAHLTDVYVDPITGKIPYNIAQKKFVLLYEGKQQKRAELNLRKKEEADRREKAGEEDPVQQQAQTQQSKEEDHYKGPTVEEIIEEEHKVFSKRAASSRASNSEAGSPMGPTQGPSAVNFPDRSSSSAEPLDEEVTSGGSKKSYIAKWQDTVEDHQSPVASPRVEVESLSSARSSSHDQSSIAEPPPLPAQDVQQSQELQPTVVFLSDPAASDKGIREQQQIPTLVFHINPTSTESLDHIAAPPALPPTVITVHRRLMTLLPDESPTEVEHTLIEQSLPDVLSVAHNEPSPPTPPPIAPTPPSMDLMPIANLGGALMRISENKEAIKYFFSDIIPIGHVRFLDNSYLMTGLHVLGGLMLVSSAPSSAALPVSTKLALPAISSTIYASKQWLYDGQKEDSTNNIGKSINSFKDFIDICAKQMLIGAEINVLTHLPYSIIFGPTNILGMGLGAIQGAASSAAMCYALHNNYHSNNHGYLAQYVLPGLASAGTAYTLYKGNMLPVAADFSKATFLSGVDKLFSSLSMITLSHYMTKVAINDMPIIDHIENISKELVGLQQTKDLGEIVNEFTELST